MSISNPYFRAFTAGAVFFAAVTLKLLSRHNGPWSTFPRLYLIVLGVSWLVTALLLGVGAKYIEKLRSWSGIILATIAGWFVVLGLMVAIVAIETPFLANRRPTFASTEQMMSYLATEAANRVKKDTGIDLDYSVDSIKVIEEELGRLAKNADKTNSQTATFGDALGFGAYVGEALRRRDGGSWAVDNPAGGPGSYPLTLKSKNVVFPVAWCWRRLMNGEEDNVYVKVMLLDSIKDLTTDGTNQLSNGYRSTSESPRPIQE